MSLGNWRVGLGAGGWVKVGLCDGRVGLGAGKVGHDDDDVVVVNRWQAVKGSPM